MRTTISNRQYIQERAREASRPRILHGYLAEDYTGIGKTVAVSLSRNSAGIAINANIAAGDSDTGQLVPAGTRVTIYVYHGQAEILSLGYH